MALWCGLVVEAPAGKVYFAGDTGFDRGRGYRAIAERHGGFRLAILPIGAYEPRWFMKRSTRMPKRRWKPCNSAMRPSRSPATGERSTSQTRRSTSRAKGCCRARRKQRPREKFRPMLPGEVWDVPAT